MPNEMFNSINNNFNRNENNSNTNGIDILASNECSELQYGKNWNCYLIET